MIKLEQAKVPPDYQADLERAAQILKEAGCSEIFLFGSLAEGNLREGSDIDLAVRGVPRGQHLKLWGRLQGKLDHPVDLVNLDAHQAFAQHLLNEKTLATMTEKLVSQITFEIDQIERLWVDYADLLAQVQQRAPNRVELAALALVLHSFYNGLENVFLAVAKRFDRNAPTGGSWHQSLLTRMTQATAQRGRVISPELAQRLSDYLEFRHFARHAYAFDLDWDELKDKVLALLMVWTQTKAELNDFVQSIGSTTDDAAKH